MSMNVGGSGKSFNSEINVTPLVDVVLVLLIIFMVIVPIVQKGYDIEIPKEVESNAPPPPDSKTIILAVNSQDCPILQPLNGTPVPASCNVRINKEAVNIEQLSSRLGEVFKNRSSSNKVLFLAAEEKMNYEAIIQIVDLARAGVGADLKIGIVTDEALAFGGGTY